METFKREDDGCRAFHTKGGFFFVSFGGAVFRFMIQVGKVAFTVDR